jgi:hypothetical protein
MLGSSHSGDFLRKDDYLIPRTGVTSLELTTRKCHTLQISEVLLRDYTPEMLGSPHSEDSLRKDDYLILRIHDSGAVAPE